MLYDQLNDFFIAILFLLINNLVMKSVMKSKFFYPGWVGSPTSRSGKFPPKIQKFSILNLGVKKSHQVRSKNTWVKPGSATFLLRVRSMIGLGRVKAHLYINHHYTATTTPLI